MCIYIYIYICAATSLFLKTFADGGPGSKERHVPLCVNSCMALLAHVNPTHCNGRRGRDKRPWFIIYMLPGSFTLRITTFPELVCQQLLHELHVISLPEEIIDDDDEVLIALAEQLGYPLLRAT